MTLPWEDPRVQRGMKALLKLRQERIAAGDKPIGWKVAFGGKGVQEKLGIGAPLVGFLTQGGAVDSGGSVSLAGWKNPLLEPEIAAYMGRDLSAGADRAATEAAIGKIGPVFELIDSERPPENVEWILSGNIAHRHVVLGPSAAGTNGNLSGRIFRRGAEFARADDAQALSGDVVTLVGHVADYLAAFGERLRAGDIVICGSIVPPIPVDPDEDSIRYALDPVGEVTVRFTH
jgi:2-keto-4-pentenoate hydratase